MDPASAFDAQIARYREMTGEERLRIALALHELSCEIARAGIRRQHPGVSTEEVENFLRARLRLANTL